MDPVVGFQLWLQQWLKDPVHCAFVFAIMTVPAVILYKMSIREFKPGEDVSPRYDADHQYYY
jgi:hypothetical protein